MERTGPGPDRENDPMIEPDADPLDTDVEDADLFLGLEDEEEEEED
jgi:hypothetical protein